MIFSPFIFSGKGSRSNVVSSSNEALDMQHVGQQKQQQRPASATSPSPVITAIEVAATHAATSNGRKKSILKKSESSSGGSHHHHQSTLRNAAKAVVPGSGNASGDPELENLLVSDPDTSANTTPASVRKPTLSMSNLPPTANHDQLKNLTGPKLRVGVKEQQSQPQQQQQLQPPPPRKPILVNNVQNNNKNNGNVASKEIQTSTANLLALAVTAGKISNNT